MKKRLLSIALSLAMVLGMLPVTVLAEGTQVTSVTNLTLAIAGVESDYPGVLYAGWTINSDADNISSPSVALLCSEDGVGDISLWASQTDTLGTGTYATPSPLMQWYSDTTVTTKTADTLRVGYYYNDDNWPTQEISVDLTIKYVVSEEERYSLDYAGSNASDTYYTLNFGEDIIPMFALDGEGTGNYNYIYTDTTTRIYDYDDYDYDDIKEDTDYYVVVYTATEDSGAYTLTLTKYPLTVNFEGDGSGDSSGTPSDGTITDMALVAQDWTTQPALQWKGGSEGDYALIGYVCGGVDYMSYTYLSTADEDGYYTNGISLPVMGSYTAIKLHIVSATDAANISGWSAWETYYDALSDSDFTTLAIDVTAASVSDDTAITLTQGETTGSSAAFNSQTGVFSLTGEYTFVASLNGTSQYIGIVSNEDGSVTLYDWSYDDGVTWVRGIGGGTNGFAEHTLSIEGDVVVWGQTANTLTITTTVYNNVTLVLTATTPTTPTTYTITYDANGGSGTQDAGTATAEVSFTLPETTTFTAPTDKQFKGWALSNDATDVITSCTFTEATTVYAIWEDVPAVTPTTPTITTAPTASAITYGQTLADSTLTGGVADVDGTFTWAESTTVPAVSDSGITEYTVTFTPNNTNDYDTVEIAVTVTVNQATITITADNKSAYRNYSEPTYSYTVTGLIGEDTLDTNPSVAGVDVDMSTNGTYTITAGGAEASANYTIEYVNGTLTISTKPSTSTSTPSTSDDDTTSDATTDTTTDTTTDSNVTVETESTTTQNDDGSTTTETVETATDSTTGEVVATTKTETAVENDDGSVTTEIAATTTNETTGEVTTTTATATTTTNDAGNTVTETIATTTNETTGAVTESTSTETVTDTGSVKEEVKTTTSAEGTVTEEKSTVIADTETKTEITATVATENGETTAAQITAVATDDTTDVTIPQDVLTTVASESAAVITVETSVAAIVLDETATNTVADAVSSAEDTQVVISAVVVEHEIVDQTITADLNNIVVVDLTISVGGENVSSFNGGSAKISIPYTPANENAPITLYYVADDGSVTLMDCTYDTETGAIIFETGHFSYYMVSENTAIGFTDVAVNAYYYDAVKFAVENGITTGKTDTTFEPATVNTRAEAVTFLWRAAGALAANPDTAFEALADVVAGEYYTDAVIWAVENGITMGTSDTAFSPDEGCTRGEIITFLYRLAGQPEVTGTCEFTDVNADEYYTDAVIWAVENGITDGMGDGLFAPDQHCSRAEIVTFLYRYMSEATL